MADTYLGIAYPFNGHPWCNVHLQGRSCAWISLTLPIPISTGCQLALLPTPLLTDYGFFQQRIIEAYCMPAHMKRDEMIRNPLPGEGIPFITVVKQCWDECGLWEQWGGLHIACRAEEGVPELCLHSQCSLLAIWLPPHASCHSY